VPPGLAADLNVDGLDRPRAKARILNQRKAGRVIIDKLTHIEPLMPLADLKPGANGRHRLVPGGHPLRLAIVAAIPVIAFLAFIPSWIQKWLWMRQLATREPTRHESPFISVHRAPIRGGRGQGCLYWDPEGSPPSKHGRQEGQDNGVRK
jgi:hypothetical protein